MLAPRGLTLGAVAVGVAETWSSQLEPLEGLCRRVRVLLNVPPDNLDRHKTFAAYLRAKARIFENQTAADCAVLNWDDEVTRSLAQRTVAHVLWFSRLAALDHGAFVRDGWIVAKLNGHAEEICPLAEIALRGAHNVENVLAATAGALWTGMAPDAIRRGVGVFRGVPHRIEFRRHIGGAAFFHDSKGTNLRPAIRAVRTFGA